MDTEQQEKGIAPFADRQKKRETVNLLLTSRYQVSSFDAAVEFLKSDRMKPIIRVGSHRYSSELVIGQPEAREYFEYLQQVASGALDAPKDTVEKAYDQLFALIYVMRKEIEIEDQQNLFAQPMLEAHLTRFEAKVGELSRLLHVRDEQISKIYKRVGELSDEFAENGEDVSSLDSSVKVLKMKVEDLDKSTEDGFANMKIILEQIRDWIGTYKQPLDWVKSEHDKIHPVNENEKKSK